MKRKLKNCGRKKAVFGEAVAAAGITAAATLTGAGIQAASAKAAAESQANSIIQGAKSQADAIKLQNDNANQLQKQSQDFTKSENDQNRQIQKDMQIMLQMLAGKEDTAEREKASMYQYKSGGKVNTSFLRGSNAHFHITDGGGVIPIGKTQQGYDLYEIVGNDHEHYHKTTNGKNKTGVGIKFENGDVVEGEGNQNTNNGELLMTTPEGGFFISKHTMNGFNPANAVRNGMNPVTAFNLQEDIKMRNNISNNNTPVKRKLRLLGGTINDQLNPIITTELNGTIPVAVGAIYDYNQNNENTIKAKYGRSVRRLKNGGSARIKFDSGGWNLLGAGITTTGNFLGAGLNILGNNYAADILGSAYNQAGNTLANAYNSLTGINENSIRREDYSAQHYLPVIRSAYYNAEPQIANINRDASRRRLAVRRNSLSSAAMLSRLADIDTQSQQKRSEVYADKANREEAIRQTNAERITQAAQKNAELDTQASQSYTNARLNLLQYNNDINNQRIMGAASARANALTQQAGAIANAKTANANALSSAIVGSGQSFANAITTNAKANEDRRNILLGAFTDAQIADLAVNGSKSDIKTKITQLNTMKDYVSGKTLESINAQIAILNSALDKKESLTYKLNSWLNPKWENISFN